MTTIIDFVPSSLGPFQFNPTLDGQVYAARVPWSLFGQRYYLELSALDGTLVVNRALVGSPIGVALQTITWDLGRVILETELPHGYRVGDTIRLAVSSCQPAVYNGTKECLVLSETELSYAAPAYPGVPTIVGRVDYNVNLVAGYFLTSTLVFREPSKQFEINPS